MEAQTTSAPPPVAASTELPAGLRVAFLTPCYWPEVRRGGERVVHELSTGLVQRGHHPRIVTSHWGRPARSVEDGVDIIRHWRPPDGRLRRRRFEDHLTHVPLSYLSLVRGDDQIVQALHVSDGLAAARWSARTGRPSILTHLGLVDRRALREARRRVEITNAAASGCTAVTAVSHHAASTFARWLGIEARAIYPPVDLDRFRPCAQRDEAPTIFCAAAAEQRHKRVGLLIEAFAHVRRDRPCARLVLLRPADPRLAQALAAEQPGVELIDNDADLLPEAYSQAWVTTLTSIGEAFGLVLAESLACGTPVVGSSHGGIPEIVDGSAVGRIFRDDDPAAIARAIVEALELRGQDGTTEACRRRAEAFSTGRCVEAHERLYAELLTRTG
jgi:glycosyltransferase involved in cell wall biosynthesis